MNCAVTTRQHVELIPGLIDRIDGTPRRGSLIVMRDKADKRKKLHLPYKEVGSSISSALSRAAGLADQVTFMGMRHGGLTELGDASATGSRADVDERPQHADDALPLPQADIESGYQCGQKAARATARA